MKKFVYADNAATTPVSHDVIEAMAPIFESAWGNPSSIHSKGREAKEILDDARERIAKVFNCNASEIYFTSCGSESDNWAIKGAVKRLSKKGRNHIVTSAIEHPAVLNTCRELEKQGYPVTYVGVDSDGVVDVDELRAAVTDKTAIVAIMYANNEVGTIQPIEEIGKIAHEKGALMFTDAVQAIGNIDIDLSKLPVDMLALSGHKIHAPKGIGMLYIKKGVVIDSLINGGGQEKRKRAGTENLPYIVGLARALEVAKARIPELSRVEKMRDRLISELEKIPYSKLNGHRTKRLAGNVNVGFVQSTPRTGRSSPESESSPTKHLSEKSTSWRSMPPHRIIPIRIAVSNAEPSFFRSAGARLSISSIDGKWYPLFSHAVRTLSFASLTARSGRPTS